MAEPFNKAPEGQPTENILLQLNYAKARVSYWEYALMEAEKDVDRAERQCEHWDNRQEELEWQLEQRKKEETPDQ